MTTHVDVDGNDKPDMSTVAAAEWVTAAPTTLKQWRNLNKGPAYHREIELGRVLDRQPDLEAFSSSSLKRIEPRAEAGAHRREPEVA